MPDDKKEIEFETAMKKLELIVEKLEGGDLSLDEAIKQYEEGVRMADACQKRLTEAQKRVEVLTKLGAGKFKTELMEGKKNSKGGRSKVEGGRNAS